MSTGMTTPKNLLRKATWNLLKKALCLKVEIEGLKVERKALIHKAQELCEHPLDEIREAPHKSFSIGSTLRPFRVCICCGLREEGWGTGYSALGRSVHSGIAQLSREEVAKRVIQ